MKIYNPDNIEYKEVYKVNRYNFYVYFLCPRTCLKIEDDSSLIKLVSWGYSEDFGLFVYHQFVYHHSFLSLGPVSKHIKKKILSKVAEWKIEQL